MDLAKKFLRIGLMTALVGHFAAAMATPNFVVPIGGTPYVDWAIVNYVDRDPSHGLLDYKGGQFTYDGHNAIDFTLPNFAAMDRGVDVLAAAPGIVRSIGDGNFDRCSRVNPCGNLPNYIYIDHGNGLVTEYLHLKTGSIAVEVGQQVSAGDKIALVGSSGLSSDAHLHFATYQDGMSIDTQFDADSPIFLNIPYAGDVTGALDFGVTNQLPNLTALVDRPVDHDTFDQRAGQQAVFWANLHGVDDGSLIDITWYRPSGELYWRWIWETGQFSFGWWVANINLPTIPDAGVWQVTLDINSNRIASDQFIVAVPESATGLYFIFGSIVLGAIHLRRIRRFN